MLLADVVEAASRSVVEPTKQKLEGLVRKLIFNKLNDGQLDDSDLTMVDLQKVERAFLKILKGIYHTRIKYPDQVDLKKLEKKVGNSNDKS